MSNPLRLGTRASALAQWQANWVAARLRELGTVVDVILMTTQGDTEKGSLVNFGGQGLFTKELQRALLANEIDLAVHSLKDLPTQTVPGLSIAAVPEREECGDALVANDVASLEALPERAVVGTGSLRRKAQLLNLRPDLEVTDIRGNVETRLKKLDDGQFQAIVLAEAGLRRLELATRISQIIPKSIMLPAIGQGALGIEIRHDDDATLSAVQLLDDPVSHQCAIAERALLATLRAGCLAPVGAWGRVKEDQLQLDAIVLSPDGQSAVRANGLGAPDESRQLGESVATELLSQGAAELIAAAH